MAIVTRLAGPRARIKLAARVKYEAWISRPLTRRSRPQPRILLALRAKNERVKKYREI